MSEFLLNEVEPGVLMIQGSSAGPESIMFGDTKYYRFMDFFYIRNDNLDSLTPAEVTNLCRARAKFPNLISYVNQDVRRIFKSLTLELQPHKLLEIGAGKNPIFASNEFKSGCYTLADADSEVVNYHKILNNSCYVFSEELCEIPYIKNAFDMVIAVFVLHFPFHSNQIRELEKRIEPSGIIIANVYRRTWQSRDSLTIEFEAAGFKLLKIEDTGQLCRDHEYWLISKESSSIDRCADILKKLIRTS